MAEGFARAIADSPRPGVEPLNCGSFDEVDPSSRYHRNDESDRDCPATIKRAARQTGTSQAAGRLMSDRIDFEIVCPNDHNQTVTFSQREFEEVLKSGALMFHCDTCDTDWPPSRE